MKNIGRNSNLFQELNIMEKKEAEKKTNSTKQYTINIT